MKNFTSLLILCLLAFIVNAQEATFNWQETILSEGNILRRMSINENVATISGDRNTFLKSTDGGSSWDTLNIFYPDFSFSSISITDNVGFLVSNREELYKAFPNLYTNGLLLKTTDRGTTWELLESPSMSEVDSSAINPFATLSFGADYQTIETINDTAAYCALRWFEYNPAGNITHQGIFKTNDGGLSWKNISGDLGNTYITTITSFNKKVVIGGKEALYQTTASADTLVDIFATMHGDGSDYINDIHFLNEDDIYLVTTSDSVYYSNDGGISFDKFGTVKGGSDILKINDTTLIVSGGSNKSYISVDNGDSWNTLNISTPVWEIGGVFNDSLFMLTKGAIYKASVASLVAGNYDFTIQEIGSTNIQKMFVIDENTVLIVGTDGVFHKSTDQCLTWNKIDLPEIPELNAIYENIDFEDISTFENKSYITIDRFKFVDKPSGQEDIYWSGGVLYSEDNWETSKPLDISKVGKQDASDPAKNPNHESCNAVASQLIGYVGKNADNKDKDILLLWVLWNDFSAETKTNHSVVFRTTDGGLKWYAVSDDFGGKYMQDIVTLGDTVYIVGSSIFQISIDKGETFTNLYPKLDIGEDDGMFIKTIVPGNENELFIVTTGDSCYRTQNGGETFSTIGNFTGSNDFYRFDTNSYILLGSNSSKSGFTNNDGETWQDCYPSSVIFEIGGVLNEKLYALAKGSIFTTPLNSLDLRTAIPTLLTNTELIVFYEPSAVKLVSSDSNIDRIAVYSMSGKLITIQEPHNRTCRFNNSDFKPGIYILSSFVQGRRYTNKVVFK